MTIRQMFIPTVGTEFKLEEDWTFPLYEERRNNPLRKALGLSRGGYTSSSTTYNEVTLKKGVTLVVDRFYIKNNAKEFDSVTFRVGEVPDDVPKKLRKKRFWAKLGDINTIKFSPVSGVPRSDGLLFLLLKLDDDTYQAPKNGYQGMFTDLVSAKKDIIEKLDNSERYYVFKVPSGGEPPYNYRRRSYGHGIPKYNATSIKAKYELVYEPVGPMGKGSDVTLRRSLYKRTHYGTPEDPREFFVELEDQEAIEEADSIYLMVDDLRSGNTHYNSNYSAGAIIFRSGSKWQARLSGKMREEAPSLHKKICDIWDTEGHIPLRTLSEGMSLLEDFFEENLDVYGRALPKVTQFHKSFWSNR